MGLINHAVPADQVLPKAREIARELAAGPTWAVWWTKLSVNKWLKQQVNLILDASLAYQMVTFDTDDHHEAARAFDCWPVLASESCSGAGVEFARRPHAGLASSFHWGNSRSRSLR